MSDFSEEMAAEMRRSWHWNVSGDRREDHCPFQRHKCLLLLARFGRANGRIV